MSESEEKEEKGFVVKDRRKISLDDTQEQPSGTEEKTTASRQEQAREKFEEASREAHKENRAPLPEATFSTFVFSLSSSALIHLGEVPDPYTQKVEPDLALAKQVIDTLGMLEEKTRGNLDPDEDRLLKSVLYDLRMRFVQKSRT